MGSVTLVGAGCGRGLITVKGMAALEAADVILYDDLITSDLLTHAKPDAELVNVGKRCGQPSTKQEEIYELMFRYAKQDKKVVRLKGGDSFVFGRGGEEVMPLQAAGIPYEIIPVVSSCIAVPESLGVPVTHRGVAQSFTVVTGHTATKTDEDYGALANLHGTLVFLMALETMGTIARKLIRNGKDPQTPACILSQGCCSPSGKRVNAPLCEIAKKAAEVSPPAILLVGEVAAMNLQPYQNLPLKNISVTVTGTREIVSRLGNLLSDLGAAVTEAVTLTVSPMPERIPAEFSGYTCLVFSSSVGVRVFFEELRRRGADLRTIAHLKFACIGSATADTLAEYGFHADIVPHEYTAANLGVALAATASSSDRILILRSAKGSSALTEALDKAEIPYEDIATYDTLPADTPINVTTDYITFGSGSGVAAFFDAGGTINHAKPVCIGNSTAVAAKRYGVKPLVAKTHTIKGIADLILEDAYETISTATEK